MRREIPLPLAIAVIVVVLVVIGVIFWRVLFKPREAELKPQEVPPVLKEIIGPGPRRAP